MAWGRGSGECHCRRYDEANHERRKRVEAREAGSLRRIKRVHGEPRAQVTETMRGCAVYSERRVWLNHDRVRD
jgi:hypothetical protein